MSVDLYHQRIRGAGPAMEVGPLDQKKSKKSHIYINRPHSGARHTLKDR